MSSGDEPVVTRRVPSAVDGAVGAGARAGLPSWVRRGPVVGDPCAPGLRTALRDLGADGWTALPALHHPGRPDGAGDVVVVGPGGVVVIAVHDGARRGDRGAAAHAMARVAEAAATVTSSLAPRHRTAVRAVLCPTGRTRRSPAGSGVAVVRLDDLAAHLRALPPRLSPVDAAGLTTHLARWLGGARRPDVLTTAALDAEPRATRRRVVRPHGSGHGVRSTPTAHVDGGRRVPATAVRVTVALGVTWLAWLATTTPLGAL